VASSLVEYVTCLNNRKQCVKDYLAKYSKENFGLPVDYYGLNKFLLRDNNYGRIFRKLLNTIEDIASQKQP
jgi:hypothetical protein